ncbi:MAG: hypothetical protein JWP58_2057 [Hymenobacter sp.]|nr:hypothetical protein [Hymenobacter sp.]
MPTLYLLAGQAGLNTTIQRLFDKIQSAFESSGTVGGASYRCTLQQPPQVEKLTQLIARNGAMNGTKLEVLLPAVSLQLQEHGETFFDNTYAILVQGELTSLPSTNPARPGEYSLQASIHSLQVQSSVSPDDLDAVQYFIDRKLLKAQQMKEVHLPRQVEFSGRKYYVQLDPLRVPQSTLVLKARLTSAEKPQGGPGPADSIALRNPAEVTAQVAIALQELWDQYGFPVSQHYTGDGYRADCWLGRPERVTVRDAQHLLVELPMRLSNVQGNGFAVANVPEARVRVRLLLEAKGNRIVCRPEAIEEFHFTPVKLLGDDLPWLLRQILQPGATVIEQAIQTASEGLAGMCKGFINQALSGSGALIDITVPEEYNQLPIPIKFKTSAVEVSGDSDQAVLRISLVLDF